MSKRNQQENDRAVVDRKVDESSEAASSPEPEVAVQPPPRAMSPVSTPHMKRRSASIAEAARKRFCADSAPKAWPKLQVVLNRLPPQKGQGATPRAKPTTSVGSYLVTLATRKRARSNPRTKPRIAVKGRNRNYHIRSENFGAKKFNDLNTGTLSKVTKWPESPRKATI